jgi:hypothetical protein
MNEQERVQFVVDTHGATVHQNEMESPAEKKEGINSEQTPQFSEVLKKRIERFCESAQMMVVMGILTIWTLFQGDIRLAGTEKNADLAFQVIISICFFFFSIEILLQCFYKNGYLNLPSWNSEEAEDFLSKWKRRFTLGSFYFWMDIVASFTLVMDMDWMLDSATQSAFQGGKDQISKSASAIRVGARVGRVIRLVRMVRLARIGKLYKYANQILCSYGLHDRNVVQMEEEEAEESHVGAAIADITNRR